MLELRPGAAKLNKKYPQRPTVQHRQLCSMLFGSLDEGSLREHGYSIYMTDSLSFSSETITTLSMGYTSVQFSRSVAQSCPTLCNPMNRSTPGLPVHHHLPEFTQLTFIESVMPSSHLILCHPLLLLPLVFPSIRV